MNFTDSQIYDILEKVITKGSGVEEILKMSLDILMKAERFEHNLLKGDLSNDYRYRKTCGHGRLLG